MEAALTSAPKSKGIRSSDGERRCLVSGEMLPKENMMRFVIGPDHNVVPDLAQNLPGRGLWVKADREALEQAVRKNLFARAAQSDAVTAENFVDQVQELLRRRCLDYMGLACRSGIVVLSEMSVEAALKGGKLALLLLADDAKHDLSNYAHDTDVCSLFNRQELGSAFGYAQSVYVGLKPHAITARLKLDLARLQSMTDFSLLLNNGRKIQ